MLKNNGWQEVDIEEGFNAVRGANIDSNVVPIPRIRAEQNIISHVPIKNSSSELFLISAS